MNKVLIVIMFILLGTSLIVLSNMNKGVENSFTIEYQNNKNLSLPDLEGKTEVSAGVYRLVDVNGVTIDYNIHNGYWIINGVGNGNATQYVITILKSNVMTLSYIYISGSIDTNTMIINNTGRYNWVVNGSSSYPNNKHSTRNDIVSGNTISILAHANGSFDKYTFRLQLENGSQATNYVVPKLIPVYKDNLTIDEKQEIGFGAFAGFTEIIRNINGFIKPIGDFINGILSWF